MGCDISRSSGAAIVTEKLLGFSVTMTVFSFNVPFEAIVPQKHHDFSVTIVCDKTTATSPETKIDGTMTKTYNRWYDRWYVQYAYWATGPVLYLYYFNINYR